MVGSAQVGGGPRGLFSTVCPMGEVGQLSSDNTVMVRTADCEAASDPIASILKKVNSLSNWQLKTKGQTVHPGLPVLGEGLELFTTLRCIAQPAVRVCVAAALWMFLEFSVSVKMQTMSFLYPQCLDQSAPLMSVTHSFIYSANLVNTYCVSGFVLEHKEATKMEGGPFKPVVVA